MLLDVEPVTELRGVARRKGRPDEFKSVRHPLVPEEQEKGWEVVKKGGVTTRLKKPKAHHVLLEDRVWSMMYRMGFTHLSKSGGAQLVLDPKDEKSPRNQLDVVALDEEVAVAVECKSVSTPRKLPDFPEDIAKHTSSRELFIKSVKSQFPSARKRQIKFAIFTHSVILGDKDRSRAEDSSVVLFDETDLEYYEALVNQVGPAARFQFLADLLPGHPIAALELTVPAVRTRMGGNTCYTFSVSPEYLLKIAYVSHRAKGKPSDVDTYQRLLKKGRLTRIREYISNDGIFPTNIVVNVDPKYMTFQRAKQEGAPERDAVVGWLQIRPAYRAAWIIDGQHRLYAYAGHPQASRSVVAVLAFAGLDPSEQARLFIDINAKQKKVKQSLLQELFAELHWTASDPEKRVRAIVSKAIQILDTQADSPLVGRILKADEARTELRCISLTSIFNAVVRTELFIARTRKGHVLEFGPLWTEDTNTTLRRTARFLGGWFDAIRTQASAVWDLGSGEGGGLAMNDGVTVCINVLRSVVQHLRDRGVPLAELDDPELMDAVRPFGEILGRYFGAMGSQQVVEFRSLRGVQGQTAGTRHCQAAIQRDHPGYSAPGLQQFLEEEKAETSQNAYTVITTIEKMLQSCVLDELKREYGEDENGWWHTGVPQAVRKKVALRIEEEGKIRDKGANLDLIDYQDIAIKNWSLFEDLLGYGKKGNKDARIRWIAEVNEIRKVVMHASKGIHMPVTRDQLAYLEQIESWLRSQIEGQGAS